MLEKCFERCFNKVIFDPIMNAEPKYATKIFANFIMTNLLVAGGLIFNISVYERSSDSCLTLKILDVVNKP